MEVKESIIISVDGQEYLFLKNQYGNWDYCPLSSYRMRVEDYMDFLYNSLEEAEEQAKIHANTMKGE
jgi:hypothetical protein